MNKFDFKSIAYTCLAMGLLVATPSVYGNEELNDDASILSIRSTQEDEYLLAAGCGGSSCSSKSNKSSNSSNVVADSDEALPGATGATGSNGNGCASKSSSTPSNGSSGGSCGGKNPQAQNAPKGYLSSNSLPEIEEVRRNSLI